MSNLAAHHGSSAYDQDKLTVHNIIIQNIDNGSDTNTYVKPHIKRDNGRRDIKALRGRYKNTATNEQYVNKVNRTIETEANRNGRAIKFDKLLYKFTQGVDESEKRN